MTTLETSTPLAARRNALTLVRGEDARSAASSSTSHSEEIARVARVLRDWFYDLSTLYFTSFFELCTISNVGTIQLWQYFNDLTAWLVEDRSHQEMEIQELRELHNLAKRKNDMEEAKLHCLAKEKKGLEVKVVQLKGKVCSL